MWTLLLIGAAVLVFALFPAVRCAVLHPLHVLHAQQRRVPRKIRLFKQVLAQWFAERPHYLLG